jgi:hypothetical protein
LLWEGEGEAGEAALARLVDRAVEGTLAALAQLIKASKVVMELVLVVVEPVLLRQILVIVALVEPENIIP